MESIGTLAGGVAHDFNNMLAAITGFSHMTMMKMEKFDPNRLNIEQIIMNLATNGRDAMKKGGVRTLTTEPVQLKAAC